jgi:hypothetical protein
MEEKDGNGWEYYKHTVVGLKDYVDSRLEAEEKARMQNLDTVEKARRDAYIAMEKRLDGMNEFRDTLRDQSARFMTRDEYFTAHQSLLNATHILENGKVGIDVFNGFHDETEKTLEDYKINKAVLATRASVSSLIYTNIFTGITLMVAIVSIILRALGK